MASFSSADIGPLAHSTIELYTPSSLHQSPKLPALFNLINHAFNFSAHKDGRNILPPSETLRLQSHEQLGNEVGPDGFILLVLSNPSEDCAANAAGGFRAPDGQRIIGTASAKPYVPTKPGFESGDAAHLLFKRPPPAAATEDNGLPSWELLAMVVDPTLQGGGIATQLMNLTIDEIKRRSSSALQGRTQSTASEQKDSAPSMGQGEDKAEQQNSDRGQVTLLLSTVKEINESFYARRGWTTTDIRAFPPGTSGSRTGFSIVEMFQVIDI